MIQAFTSASFRSFDLTGLERQAVIQTNLKPLKKHGKKKAIENNKPSEYNSF